MGVLILGSGLLFEYASARGGNIAHKAAVGIAVVAGLGLIWVNLAVGMMDDEGNPANLMYLLVLFVALVGAAIARFEPREASIAMFATAGAQAVVVVIALVGGAGADAAGRRVLHRGVGRIGPALPAGQRSRVVAFPGIARGRECDPSTHRIALSLASISARWL